VDKRWQSLLSKQVQSANVELIATLGLANMTVEQVMKMHTGDVIPLSVDEYITASVDGVPMMECKYGALNNQYALKIERMLTSSEGENHVG
jgi:flagellar motor switch protein FliM